MILDHLRAGDHFGGCTDLSVVCELCCLFRARSNTGGTNTPVWLKEIYGDLISTINTRRSSKKIALTYFVQHVLALILLGYLPDPM